MNPDGTLSNVNTAIIQYYAIFFSISYLIFIFELVRRKKIKEQYSILWFATGIVFLFFSIWRDALDLMSVALGVAYPPAAFILILIIAIFMILIQYSVVISNLSENNKELIQQNAIMSYQIEKLNKEFEKIKKNQQLN